MTNLSVQKKKFIDPQGITHNPYPEECGGNVILKDKEVDTAVFGPYDDLAVVNSWLEYTEFEKSKNSMD